MLIDINESKILQTSYLNNLFKTAVLKDINENCTILNTDFYLDSFNYFPITKNNETFVNLFKRQDDNPINHFYSEDFYNNFIDKKNSFKLVKGITFVVPFFYIPIIKIVIISTAYTSGLRSICCVSINTISL